MKGSLNTTSRKRLRKSKINLTSWLGYNNPTGGGAPVTASATMVGTRITMMDQVTYADILAPTPTGSVDYEQLELYWSMFGVILNEDEYVTVVDLMSVIPEIGGVVRYDPATDSYVNMTGADQITQGMGLWVYCMSDVTLAMNYAFVVQKI